MFGRQLMAGGIEVLVVFWKEWGIQTLVLLSFALQVILLFSSEIRQYKDSGVLRAIIWSAYLLADTTAIYALGHMSVTSCNSSTRLPEHQLMALWAPFLLLHLGGQDNITAYSIEDNRLWLRHLQTLVVQAGVPTWYWSGCMGQHNFIQMCTQSRNSRSSKVARSVGREDWWNTLVYTSSIPVPAEFSQLLETQLSQSHGISKESPDHIHNSRGRAVLIRMGISQKELACWSVDIQLDESILVWHIATHVYLSWHNGTNAHCPALPSTMEMISNYMVFLLAARPYMLPDNASRQSYVELCNKVINQLEYSSAEDLVSLIRERGKELLNTTGPHETAAENSPFERSPEPAVEPPETGEQNSPFDRPPEPPETGEQNSPFYRACQLSAKLISKSVPGTDTLGLILQVWVEMLCYVSYRCRPDSHARQLSNGGEITTVIAILMEYHMRPDIFLEPFGIKEEEHP